MFLGDGILQLCSTLMGCENRGLLSGNNKSHACKICIFQRKIPAGQGIQHNLYLVKGQFQLIVVAYKQFAENVLEIPFFETLSID